MAKFKDFGAGTGAGEKEPVSFMLHGESFDCRPELQGKVLLDLVARSSGDNPADAAKTISDFFKNVLVADSYTRFDALLTDPDKIVSVDTLGQISAWLVEVYTARPTQGPEASSTGA
jgi:hypothetical protein